MLIPLIPKDPDRTDLSCRDGEIDFITYIGAAGSESETPEQNPALTSGRTIIHSLTPTQTYPTATVRIPLQNGDKPKAELMLTGDISRVDPDTADRLTQAIIRKAAETLLDLSTDLRRQGLFILPFRVYSMIMMPDGSLSYPSPQAVALPSDFPPHPEITAASVADDCLTLALRFPVRPHRITVGADNIPEGCRLRTFISYPLYIPDPKEMRGSIGSVRSAAGGNTTGIRFVFLSSSAIKASVAAPEKYYELVGNVRTGYRLSSRAAEPPDYACHASACGYVAPFTKEALLATGTDVDPATDPMDWIADWRKKEGGYLPVSLPYTYWGIDGSAADSSVWPDGIDAEFISRTAEALGDSYVMLTRPMCFAADSDGRRHAGPTAIGTLRIAGLPPGEPAVAIIYGSDDGIRWKAMRRFDPRLRALLLTPPRLFWRLLLMRAYPSERHKGGAKAIFLETCVLEVGLRPLPLQ